MRYNIIIEEGLIMNCLKRSLFLLTISFVLVGGCNTSGGGGSVKVPEAPEVTESGTSNPALP